MKGIMLSLQHKDEPSFLTADEVPANKKFKIGDEVHLRVQRAIIRSGYRQSPADFRDQACELARKHGTKLLQEIQSHINPLPANAAFDLAPKKISNKVYSNFVNVIAGMLCENAHFGGPDRGIHIEWLSSHCSMWTYEVKGFKRFQVGRRYPASYGRNYDDSDDYEPGGLADRKTVVAVETDYGLFFSGDCEKVV